MRKSVGRRSCGGLFFGSIGAFVFLAIASWGQLAFASAADRLTGRWSGWGAVRLTNGTTEQVKCVATYFLKDAGNLIDQNLRCASASYKIDAKARYALNGNAVTGSWEERTHSAQGDVTGTMVSSGFQLTIRGDTFVAKMVLTSTDCKQSINISPKGLNISNISIGLRKC